MIRKLMLLAAGASALSLSANASAVDITYTGSQQVGTINATYSITTDGTIGRLSSANVVSYTATVSMPGATDFTFGRTRSGGDNLDGSLIATATSLTVPFIESFQLYSITNAGVYTALINFTTFGTRAQFNGSAQQNTVNDTSTPFATATPAPAAVPEPATWGLLLTGFGMVGAGLRSRRRSTTVRYG